MDAKAKAARAEYQRQWRKNNPDKVKAITERYWLNRAKRELAEQEATDERRNDMDTFTAEIVARHIRNQMQQHGKNKEELLSWYEKAISPEYADDLRNVIRESEKALKCPIEDFCKTMT